MITWLTVFPSSKIGYTSWHPASTLRQLCDYRRVSPDGKIVHHVIRIRHDRGDPTPRQSSLRLLQ